LKQLRRQGVALAYEEAGSGAPPLVLVHDLAADHTCFASQFAHFGARHRVVAVDLRGHGQSDRPDQACTVALLADDLAWLCYELGLFRPVLLGHGLGGLVALDLAARYPDLPAAIVAVLAAPVSSAALATLPQHAAVSLLENVSACDIAAAAHGCVVPVLRIAFHAGEGPLPEDANELVDRFLSEMAERAPP
jgi:pimeloyl-ACP methyl ester carboxylesterase